MKICKNCNIEYESGNFCKKCGSELVEKEEQTLVCAKCGMKLEPGEKFCSECGAKVTHQKLVCSYCGKELKIGAKFCSECGTKVGEEILAEKSLQDINKNETSENTESIEATVKRIIASICGRSPENVMSNHVITCIGGNVHFVCSRLMDEFGIRISDEKKIFTVGDAVNVVLTALAPDS